MSKKQQEDDFARTRVAGLMFACPLGECLPGCPLKAKREQPKSELVKVFRQMTTEDYENIYKHHLKCLAKREMV